MSKNVPEVRFERFSEEWRPINLSELMDFSNGINAPKESYGKGRKMISVMDILDKSYLKYENIRSSVEVSPSIEEKNKVEYGDLIFVRSSEVAEEVGWSKAYLEKEYALYSGFSIRGKKKGSFNPSFIELSLNYINRKQIERKSGGSTRFNISQKILNTIEILKAPYEEQQKIGNLFKQLDDIIALHQQLVKQHQQYKKAMLQKMFPQKGECMPKVRFDGFNGDWEEKTLGEVSNITTGKLDANAMKEDGQYDFYTSGIQKYKIDIPAFKGPAITIAGNGATVGYMHYADGEFNAYQRTYVLTEFKADRRFLFSEIGNKLPKKINQEARTGNIPYIVKDMLTDLNVLLPSNLEQQKIGAFFKQLDDTIVLHEKNLEGYQQLKKALLQSMFV
ncbi:MULTISPECIES: restriction endonuclease subunit S [unclassified Bacillus cereus group]|uniref:restriction endonuclease subunit S n=1 Tax=unclassified Bacillus cereus group TaxID=2750818 RepID=UPI0008A81CB3|nr:MULTISPECIES: restriction endonuclease subunit S [unclassified Bacillus cereus group]AOY18377.1 hypothetical protein BGI23_24780 [Bacillus sp. ABP14]